MSKIWYITCGRMSNSAVEFNTGVVFLTNYFVDYMNKLLRDDQLWNKSDIKFARKRWWWGSGEGESKGRLLSLYVRWFMVYLPERITVVYGCRKILGEMLSKESSVPSDRRSRTMFGCAEGYTRRGVETGAQLRPWVIAIDCSSSLYVSRSLPLFVVATSMTLFTIRTIENKDAASASF